MAATAFAYRSRQNSSDSESEDSDRECQDWKRASRRTEEIQEKIPIDVPQSETPPNPTPDEKPIKRKRNNIWCEVMEDQLLSESLDHIGVKQLPKGYGSRGEESYDYTLARKYYRKDEDLDGKMSEDDMSDSTEASSVVSFQSRRYNGDRHVELDSVERKAAYKIVNVLNEHKKYLIRRVVKFLGVEKAMDILKMTEDIEEKGGMMIKNNARRRTPGGVYFQLLRSDKMIEKSVMDKIFEGELNSFETKRLFEEKRKQRKKRKAALKVKKESLATTFPEPKLEETFKMEEESVVMKEEPVVMKEEPSPVKDTSSNANGSGLKGSDLEDGEIDD